MTARTIANDRYVLERRLGNGGMASVYLARDPKLDRPVAVKLLADNFAENDVARKRFEREARLAAKLDHPNVVRVFDVGEEEGGRPFIVMEHVDGGTLADLTKRRRPPRERALDLLSQACAGLGHAHRKGLVHRDVKPQNLLISSGDGQLKIADFGIARAADEAGITQTGFVLGTKPYMAPEQLEGGKLTPATDVYALGVLGRELLGKRTPPELDEVLERCLNEDPRRRFRDARELGRALDKIDRDETKTVERTAAKPAAAPSPPTRSRRTTRPLPRQPRGADRRRALVALAAGAAVVLAIVALTVGSGGDGSEGDGASGSAKVEPAPRLDDPAQQGRAFADWLRDRSR